MRSKAVSKICALLLSAAITLPAAGSAILSASAESSYGSYWSVSYVDFSDSGVSLDLPIKKAFQEYQGAKLTPLAKLGMGVVAGYNHRFLCVQAADVPGGSPSIKIVTVYEDPNGKTKISGVEPFSIDDHYKNNKCYISDTLVPGSFEFNASSECDLPNDVKSAFDDAVSKNDIFAFTPVAFLGARSADGVTEYAVYCNKYTLANSPDVYGSVVFISKDKAGRSEIKYVYDMLGKRTRYLPQNNYITYDFADDEENAYAEGEISFTPADAGKYSLYWANGTGALDGFYPIAEFNASAWKTYTVSMGYHTAIPAGADRIIAAKGSKYTSDCYSMYRLPSEKVPYYKASSAIYSFSTYSDIHIDKGSLWYVNAEKNFNNALMYSAKKNTNFIVVSGDVVTNDSQAARPKEWDAYQKILSSSGYLEPVWESDGNHDMRQGVEVGLDDFVKATGTDGLTSDLPYFCMKEDEAGDIFIFMALELNKAPNKADEFTDAQINWVNSIIEENYGKRKIFIIQHSPIKGYGAGDRIEKPYYSRMLNPDNSSTKKFKAILEKYPEVMFISGHTHEDFSMGYNYSNEGGTSANMIHVPSLAGSTMPDSTDEGLDRNGGKGFNSQGYYVEVYYDQVVFYGVNLTDGLIYPQYSYVMQANANGALEKPDDTIALSGENVSMEEMLNNVEIILNKYYKYASYDAYQALKKYYYQNRAQKVADKNVYLQFKSLIDDLSRYTGEIGTLVTYYFTNSKSWDKVYAYTWNGSDKNADWPGVKINKAGVNMTGQDVYGVTLKKGQYKNIIFNNGNGTQTVDIPLPDESTLFYPSGSSNGKIVCSTDQTAGISTHEFNLLYYISDEHKWTDLDKVMNRNKYGKYEALLYLTGTKNISFSLYDKITGKYYCPSESVKKEGDEKLSFSVPLISSAARGKSITVTAPEADSQIRIVYDPDNMELEVTYVPYSQRDVPINYCSLVNSTITKGETAYVRTASENGTGNIRYSVFYRKESTSDWTAANYDSSTDQYYFKPGAVTNYKVKTIVEDDFCKVEQILDLTVEPLPLKNTSKLSASNIAKGGSVTVTAGGTGGTGTLKYFVAYHKAGSVNWTTVQKYSTNRTVTITPTAATNYEINVSVKDGSGKIVSKTMPLVVGSAALKNTSKISATRISQGDLVRITAGASGGTPSYTYTVSYKKASSEKWTVSQYYKTNIYVSLKPASKGEYNVCVKAKDATGKIVKKYFTFTVV